MVQPLIREYSFGYIVVDNEGFSRDIIITPEKIIPNWWRIEGHYLVLEDITKYVDIEKLVFDAVVIGTGYDGLMKVDPKVVEWFKSRGVDVYIGNSRESVKKYNELVKKGFRVLAMFHLTC
ncbi:MAG: hypothetical protein B6U89_02195 [Desulfurococcales archaeon ex4484_58]|nr:MAG: hypothetical protein B6U89_02195 [Desulfurococcales archaeon ex4484_58]